MSNLSFYETSSNFKTICPLENGLKIRLEISNFPPFSSKAFKKNQNLILAGIYIFIFFCNLYFFPEQTIHDYIISTFKCPCKLIQLTKFVTEILHVTLSLAGRAHIVIEMLHITLALTGEIYIRYD